MKQYLKRLKEFNNSFGIPVGSSYPKLRYELMKEENEEYLEAIDNKDLVETADAIGDMLYILCGTIVEHGLEDKIEAIFNEIHDSNMSKLDTNGNAIRRKDGKILKGQGYFRPNLKAILDE